VKSASIRDFRARLAEFLEGQEPIVLTRHGKSVAILYPFRHIPKTPSPEVIAVYKRDVDRTLIRENLRRTPEERLKALQAVQQFASEVRRARRR
jgi:antitoxin (DNA-binding transcriptional repressor) of toxin-antitoxin stability system